MYLHQRALHRDPTIAFAEACQILLENNRSIANRLFDEPRGALAAGQLADIMIPEYLPFTPLNRHILWTPSVRSELRPGAHNHSARPGDHG